ncbi:MATH domain-containing protein [Platanthera guangdongensis]|uniref:MATH domain-containing protein n=1 Tax=Platanthera guangdongensis TaxID=2320717 RepID=A0ABR2LV58_9ASPA
MDGSCTEDYGTGGMSSPTEGRSAGKRCQSVDSLAEWRSSEQLENGVPSTSPPYWDTEDDDDGAGPRPSELYGKFTWKIENYSQINKRELRSNAFEVGGYKWYILIYPQGCDVCNHLSLFLCVANHDKLLPGWSHFAQFTIAVVNKDTKKTKFSDTLHRFWKKEHDWGWKKFMELSKVEEGFVNNETLVIKAQVQVIREKVNRPFRCLDCQYRRELVRVYLSNVEQICRRFFEDRKNKLGKLIEDKVRWSSFCAFWLGIDQNCRRRISRDKLDTILRVVVKQFFVEKEVTSTLVMDSLYSGLRSLESQNKSKKERMKIEMEESPAPLVRVDKDMFVLADDILLLLERVASEPLPAMSLPPKDDKVSQNRTKDGCSAEDLKDSIERDERRLTELGRRTIEIFVLSHIFSIIEVAYQEAVALKRQEELIREEEAAGQAEHELKAKRIAAEKDKRAKKKQGKKKPNNRKSKEKQRELKYDSIFNDKKQEGKSVDEIASVELSVNVMNERMGTPEDASDVSCNGDEVAEPIYPDLEDQDSGLLNWDTDASELLPSLETRASQPGKMNIGMDDCSSTCSSDSLPSVVSNGTEGRSSVIINNIQTSPNWEKNHGGKDTRNRLSTVSHSGKILDSCPSTCLELEGDVPQKRSIQWHGIHLVQKQDGAAALPKKTSKDRNDTERQSNTRTLDSFPDPLRKAQHPVLQQAKQPAQNSTVGTNAPTASISLPSPVREPPSSILVAPKRSAALSAKSLHTSASRYDTQKSSTTPAAKNSAAQASTAMSRPSSAPLIPVASRPIQPVISAVQVTPLLLRSASATGRLATDPSISAPSYIPQSYRNAIIGRTAATVGLAQVGLTPTSGQSSSAMLPPPSRKEQQMASGPGFTFGSVKPEALHIQQQQRNHNSHHGVTSGSISAASTLVIGIEQHQRESLSGTSLSQSYVGVADEFPHLDIINELLDEEQSIMGRTASVSSQYYHPHHQPRHLFSRQYSFPGEPTSTELILLNNSVGRFDHSDRYYDDSYLSLYDSSSGRVHRRSFTDANLSAAAYANCQMDGLIQTQWPFSHADLNVDGDGGYPYQQHSGYTNMGSGLNGYGLYRP